MSRSKSQGEFFRPYRYRFHSITPAEWERLDHAGNPFLSHAFLGGLEATGCIGPDIGWMPYHLALYEGDQLVAFAPTYIKTNSHGEFVFDWAWADAFQRHGLPYYPKLLTAVPYSPVTGPRLLTAKNHPAREALKERLIEYAAEECQSSGFSSWHCNFIAEDEQAASLIPDYWPGLTGSFTGTTRVTSHSTTFCFGCAPGKERTFAANAGKCRKRAFALTGKAGLRLTLMMQVLSSNATPVRFMPTVITPF